ncbi:DNA damage-induced apoptosis suppressor protein [Sciurus carolinensis]|uniref:DNA damage-induced apoptosis suppressor protein n=1 Tax=Sciurus carolinensis TaxID=30640 RepID=UPI001FB3A0FB|nr:DNA damage-induced apoptosis suppressor protein [Sciurus carolinensis]XP_047372388.1 DNA damage-induced apoptosis suppressor protein [Sciurus carolinensis]
MNRRKFLLASVLALQNSSFIYPSCQRCFSRIIFVSKRSSCPKCGCTSEAENANYRYKLSLKVAESNKLYAITIFGSCLDKFFGLTATGLHRYIQDHNKIPETLGSDITQSLLTKAVETCFVGQSFIFGVTNFEKQYGNGSDSSNFLPQCHGYKGEVRALVACQILLPDPHVAGFTVIDYFHQLLQTSNFRKLQCAFQEPNSHLLALDHSNSDLSSINGSDSTTYFSEPHSRDNFTRFWQPSLELTSIVSPLTDNDDFSASEQSVAIGTLHQNGKYSSFAKIAGSSNCCDPIQGSWSLISYMDKKSTAEKSNEELDFQANQLSAVHSNHEIGVTDFNLFPLKIRELHESSNAESFHSAVKIKNSYSQSELYCYPHHNVNTTTSLQDTLAHCPSSSFRPGERASNSHDCDPMIWDDLPFSESLNKFLAVVESEITITQTDTRNKKHDVDNNTSKFHTDHSRLYVTPRRTAGTLHTPPIVLRSKHTVKTHCSKDNFFSNCEANLSPVIQKETESNNTAEVVSRSSNGRDTSEYFLLDPYLSTLLPSSKDLETTVKKTIRILPQKDEISLRPNNSENDHFYLSIKYFSGEKSLSEVNEKLTASCSKKYNDVSDVCKLENKRLYRWPKNQDDSFTVCKKLTYPLETLCNSTDTLKEMPFGHIDNNLTQIYSADHEGSYNASADLFDDIAKDVAVATEIIQKPQDILLQCETSLTENHLAEPDFSGRSLSENSSQTSQKLPLQSTSTSKYLRTYSPLPHFQSDSECDLEDSQDFVPCSQSTPVTGFHQRIHGINEAFHKLPALYSDLDANHEKIRISPENDKQQAIPSCSKHMKTRSRKFRSPIISSITQSEMFNNCNIAECLETDIDEWVPPTPKNDSLGFQVMGLRKCFTAHNSPDQKELPRKKLKLVKQRTDIFLVKKKSKNMFTEIVAKQKTPEYNRKQSGWISKESILGHDFFSEVKCCLPSEVSETKSTWSPELFS